MCSGAREKNSVCVEVEWRREGWRRKSKDFMEGMVRFELCNRVGYLGTMSSHIGTWILHTSILGAQWIFMSHIWILYCCTFFFSFFQATPTAYGSFQARDWIWATAAIQAAAVAILDFLTYCARLGIKPAPPQWSKPLQLILNPLHHGRNAHYSFS